MASFEVYEFKNQSDGLYALSEIEVDEVSAPAPTEEAIAKGLTDFGQTYKVHELSDGTPVGIGVVNPESLDNAKAFVLTHNSKNEQNPGHVFELCVQAAINPNQAIISVDSPRHLTWSEIKHLRKTGRFTYYDKDEKVVRGIPTLEATGNLLDSLGYRPKYISGNHAGAHFGLGIAMGLPEGSVEGIYANGLHITKSGARPGNEEFEDVKGEIQRRFGPDKDEWAPTLARREQVKKFLPEIYGGPNYKPRMAALWLLSTVYDLGAYRPAWSTNAKLTGNGTSGSVADAVNVLKYHEAAMLNAQFNKGDKTQTKLEALVYGQLVTDLIHDQRVRIIFSEGSRDEHTNHPSIRWEPEQWALSH